jgi:hypothetical protein
MIPSRLVVDDGCVLGPMTTADGNDPALLVCQSQKQRKSAVFAELTEHLTNEFTPKP